MKKLVSFLLCICATMLPLMAQTDKSPETPLPGVEVSLTKVARYGDGIQFTLKWINNNANEVTIELDIDNYNYSDVETRSRVHFEGGSVIKLLVQDGFNNFTLRPGIPRSMNVYIPFVYNDDNVITSMTIGGKEVNTSFKQCDSNIYGKYMFTLKDISLENVLSNEHEPIVVNYPNINISNIDTYVSEQVDYSFGMDEQSGPFYTIVQEMTITNTGKKDISISYPTVLCYDDKGNCYEIKCEEYYNIPVNEPTKIRFIRYHVNKIDKFVVEKIYFGSIGDLSPTAVIRMDQPVRQLKATSSGSESLKQPVKKTMPKIKGKKK